MKKKSKTLPYKKIITRMVSLVLIIFILSLSINIIKLCFNSFKPVDGFLVLGGSIHREIFVADLAKQNPNIPIIISQGSDEPCIWRIFDEKQAPINQVWVEKCANSTFENFFYTVPIFSSWKTHKVKLITSPSHLPRAQILGHILLGGRGIAMELEVVKGFGIPGNQESIVKTTIDVLRTLIWVVLSQIINPQCPHLNKLVDIDMISWQNLGFKCEYTGKKGQFR